MSGKRRSKTTVSLSKGRPPFAKKSGPQLSAQATRSIIQSHHKLHKELAKAIKDGDEELASSIKSRIEASGGLNSYQQASILGQSSSRGGDSSKILMEWLGLNNQAVPESSSTEIEPIRLLEVGALSPTNACSRSTKLSVTRIDLHSQHPDILEQDFMKRPLPMSDGEKFDIISLSLVVNYVPQAEDRGEMLRRTRSYLRHQDSTAELLPSVFLVLPAPCVTNSRYLTEEVLTEIMGSLGFSLAHRKISAKLVYYLWKLDGASSQRKRTFSKTEVHPGKARNNFCIALR